MDIADYAWLTTAVYIVSMSISLVEMLLLTVVKKEESFLHAYGAPIKNALFIALVTSVLPLLGTVALALVGSQFAPVSLSLEWWVWPLGLLVFEFWYWVQHYLGHKVRLLWCIHAPHHAPDTLTSLIGLGRHIVELPYLSFFLGFMTALCGIPVEVIFFVSIVDGFWGKFLHISPKLVTKRYGPLEYFMQTPSYHQCHHAKNLRYMDTNYNSITLFWDWLLGTLQPLRDDEPAQFGITREVNCASWFDVQFSEYAALGRDVRSAPGLVNKLLYLVMPPGWSHTGDHKMVTTLKRGLAAEPGNHLA